MMSHNSREILMHLSYLSYFHLLINLHYYKFIHQKVVKGYNMVTFFKNIPRKPIQLHNYSFPFIKFQKKRKKEKEKTKRVTHYFIFNH